MTEINLPPKIKKIRSEEATVYTWNGINVFAKSTPSLRSKICRLFKPSEISKKKPIVKNAFGVAYPGEILAILGSSGAGKTTLLDALTFRTLSNLVVSGIRYVNGVPVTSKKVFTNQSAYVQQDDLFIGNLTVKEHLTFQAYVRMNSKLSHHKRMQRVDEVISELGLSHCKNCQIGIGGRVKGISGGELRRLAFASELLTNPKLMFCDEPTSGLDSFLALSVVQILKNMANSGKTVICTIHQPSSEIFFKFDKILLMSEGRIAFLGDIQEAQDFFITLDRPCPFNYNPADYFVQVLAIIPGKEQSCLESVNVICNSYEKSEIGVRVRSETGDIIVHNYGVDSLQRPVFRGPYKVSWWAQLKALLWRSCLTVLKEPLLMKVRLTQTSIMAIIVGMTYYGQELNHNGVMNINGVLFVYTTTLTIQNVVAVINVFCGELPIFLREHRNGMYRSDVYFISKTLAEIPSFIVIPCIFTAISYYLIGLNPNVERFIIACGILTLIANVSTSFGYLISCASSTLPMALSLGPPLIIPFILFGGFLLNIDSVPKYFKWMTYLSWFRFGNEALMINQWKNVTNIKCPVLDSACPKDGETVLKTFSFSEDNFTMDIIMLIVLIFGFRLMAFFALLVRTCQYK